MPGSRMGSWSLGSMLALGIALMAGPAAADDKSDRIAEVGASVNTSTKAEVVGTDLVALPEYAALDAPARASAGSRKGARAATAAAAPNVEVANVLSAGIDGAAEAAPIARKASATTKARAAKKKKKAT